MYAYGINPTNKQVRNSIKSAKKVYDALPETTCDHRACCCNAGCPNMYYSEYLDIKVNYVDKMGKEERLQLLLDCIWYYLLEQHEEVDGKMVAVKKPCLHLDDEKGWCKVYDARPLKCRTYGLVPPDMHRKVVDQVAEESGVEKGDVPLCIQCPFVKIKPEYKDRFPDGVVPEETIRWAEEALMAADRDLGISKEIQKQGYGFLTWHDWHIMSEIGEGWMATLTVFRKEKDREWKEKFLEDMKMAFEASGSEQQKGEHER